VLQLNPSQCSPSLLIVIALVIVVIASPLPAACRRFWLALLGIGRHVHARPTRSPPPGARTCSQWPCEIRASDERRDLQSTTNSPALTEAAFPIDRRQRSEGRKTWRSHPSTGSGRRSDLSTIERTTALVVLCVIATTNRYT
jgi:hypothetical protein